MYGSKMNPLVAGLVALSEWFSQWKRLMTDTRGKAKNKRSINQPIANAMPAISVCRKITLRHSPSS